MRALPAGWPAASNDAVNDDVLVSLPDATWLAGPQVVDSFSIKRELVGSILPSQIRAGSGLSVASGDCVFYHRAVDGAPWRQGDAKVTPTGSASLYAQAGSATIPLGTFQFDAAAGILSQSAVTLDLIDEKLAHRQINEYSGYLDTTNTAPADSAWIVDTEARELGFYSTPPPVISCVLSLPMAGSYISERPLTVPTFVSAHPTGWDARFGTISPVGAWGGVYNFTQSVPVTSFFFTATFSGSVYLTPSEAGGNGAGPTVYISRGTFGVINSVMSPEYIFGTYVAGDDPNHPDRAEVQCERLGVSGAWTGFRARVRSSATSAWSAWATDSAATVTDVTSTFVMLGISVVGVAPSLIALQVTSATDAGVWVAPTATIYPLGNSLRFASLPATQDPWAAIQEVVASGLGAAFVDAGNKLAVRDFGWLRGARPVDATMEVGDDFDDMGWKVTNQDVADRVEVSYRPPDIAFSTSTVDYEMWSAVEAYELLPNATRTIIIDRTPALNVRGFLPVWNTFYPAGRYSRWSARPNRDGTGTQPADTALSFSLAPVNSRRAILSIINNTAGTLYTVDASGDPVLILRGNGVVSQDTENIVSSGLAEDVAVSPLRVDLGNYCQNEADALRVLEFVTAQTQTARMTIDRVLVPFDWRRELGDIYTLTHADTLLDIKVLCVGIDVQGSPGDYRQLLDFVRPDNTIYDFNTVWGTTATVADFNTKWAGKTFANLNADPLAT